MQSTATRRNTPPPRGPSGIESTRRLGVVAGMGPRSTAPFTDMLVEECELQYGARRIDEYAPLLISSLPAPLHLDEPLDLPRLVRIIGDELRFLEASGATVIVMPCNTVHLVHEELSQQVRTPLLHIAESALARVPRRVSRVAVASTRFVAESPLYRERLESRGLDVAQPRGFQRSIEAVLEAIHRNDLILARGLWTETLELLQIADVECLIIACTDLNAIDLVPEGLVAPRLMMLDATRCLASDAVARWLQENRREILPSV